jgi:hypothetical protein
MVFIAREGSSLECESFLELQRETLLRLAILGVINEADFILAEISDALYFPFTLGPFFFSGKSSRAASTNWTLWARLKEERM